MRTKVMPGVALADCGEKETAPLKELPHAINFRDVSNLDPSRLKHGILYRCSELFKLETLADYGIKTLVDLRKQSTGPETHPVYCVLEDADKSVDAQETHIFHHDMIQTPVKLAITLRMPGKIWLKVLKGMWNGVGAGAVMCPAVADDKYMGFATFYKILIDKAGPTIAETMRIFADHANYPILFHCTHGKDRAGIVCCLLSLLAGISPEVICEDYVVSGLQLKAAKETYELPIDERLMADPIIAAPYHAMEGLIQYIQEKYGDIDGYLRSIGLVPEEIASIRCNILKE